MLSTDNQRSSESPDRPSLFAKSNYGKTAKELHEVVKRMRAKGGQTVVDLPRIVLLGNQSAGKSSLITSISEVNVPRDDGTSTRCPMEIRLSGAPDGELWWCQIYIRFEFDAAGHKCSVREVPFGPRVEKKEDVERMLRRAQAAVLNPTLDVSHFVNMDDEELRASAKTVLFSRNVVCVDLTGPGLVDLSFVDLPGIIQNAENDPEGKLVRIVEDLATSYLTGNSLILVTISMSDDIENQKAGLLAKQADPHGVRTIGVLTKADTVPSGSISKQRRWADVLEGNLHSTKHGYFCTRLPDDKERLEGITPDAARKAETSFFDTKEPWATSSRRERCGTHALVNYVSDLLTQFIRESLPKIMHDVEVQMRGCKKQLDALPRAVSAEPCSFVNGLLMEFCDELKAHMRGSPTCAALVQRNKQSYGVFRLNIRSTAPSFIPFDMFSFGAAVSTFTSKYFEEGQTHKMYLNDVRQRILQHVTRELPNNVPYAAKVSLIQDFQKSWEQSAIVCFETVQKTVDLFLTERIEKHFQQYGNLKAVVNPVVKDKINAHAERALSNIRTLLTYESTFQETQNLEDLAEKRSKWLSIYKDARTWNNRTDPQSQFFGTPNATTSQPSFFGPSTDTSGTAPGSRPSTSSFSFAGPPPQQKPPFAQTGSSSAQGFAQPSAHVPSGGPPFGKSATANPPTGANQQPSPPPPSSTSSEDAAKREDARKRALEALSELGIDVKAEDLAKLTPPDEQQEVLELMAEVRAYFDIAYKRIIDYVMFAIDQHFLYEFSATLHKTLYEKLGLGAPNTRERCTGYLVEDPSVVARRDELLAKIERLEEVYKALINFGL